jgi:hypothetical protein
VPPSLTIPDQSLLYLKSVILPPFGFLWATKYLKQKDTKSKTVGVIAILLTVVSFVITILLLKNSLLRINDRVNEQFKSLDSLY